MLSGTVERERTEGSVTQPTKVILGEIRRRNERPFI
jgi:hypothetical protein